MRAGRVVVAATLIVAGALYLIAAVSELDAGAVVADWWPLVIIGLGIAQFVVDRTSAYGSVVLIGIGALLLLFSTGLVSGSVWSFVAPIVLVLAGIALLLPSRTGTATSDAEDLAAFSAFGTRTVAGTSSALSRAEATVIAGGLVVDLTGAAIRQQTSVRVLAILGGCQIIVPEGWVIRLSGVPLLGGWDDTTRKDGLSEQSPQLTVRAVTVLAGVEVRHAARWS